MNFIKRWQSIDIKAVDMPYSGFKEVNKLYVPRMFAENINVLVKFFYHDAFTKTLVESPLFLLDKTILKELKSINKDLQSISGEFFEPDATCREITPYTAFDYVFQSLKIREVFPHTLMTFYLYSDNRTKTPKQFVQEKIIPANKNQITFQFN